ncbi:MAG: hypothetical protein BWY64_03703 [bacterium ADurb.Bin363]|nr:MAG: hypothetical protein BWY64_03703 [bacterium ADurb.Bin363]
MFLDTFLPVAVLRNAGEGGTMDTVTGVKAGYYVTESAAVGVTSAVLSLGTGVFSGLGRIIASPFKGH